MTAARESRPGGDRAASFLAESSSDTSVAHLIGHTVEKALDGTLWRLLLGEIQLTDLTPALRAWYFAGHADGIASQRARIAYLEHAADRLWLAAFSDRDLAKRIQQRMDEQFRVEMDALVHGDHVLHEWRESQFPKDNPLGYFATGVPE